MEPVNSNQQHLKQSALFRNYSVEFFDVLFENKQFRKYAKNEIIFKQNDLLKGVFFLQEGMAKIFTSGKKNKDFILRFARPGDILGADMHNKNHLFSASAIIPVKACFVPYTDFKTFIDNNPALSKKMMKILCEEINSIEERITSISHKAIRERVAEILISSATKRKSFIDANASVNYSIKDLANTIGAGDIYLYTVLTDFKNNNVVAIQGKTIVIKDFDKLSLIAIGEDTAF